MKPKKENTKEWFLKNKELWYIITIVTLFFFLVLVVTTAIQPMAKYCADSGYQDLGLKKENLETITKQNEIIRANKKTILVLEKRNQAFLLVEKELKNYNKKAKVCDANNYCLCFKECEE